jgi:hypothetical protein
MDDVERKRMHTRLRWILSLSLLILTFIFFQIDYTRFVPVGRFSGGSVAVDECSFEGLTLVGVGGGEDAALRELQGKKLNYAHLYCNGKFKDDPESLAIAGLGCGACKPHCSPQVSEASGVSYDETWDEKTTATQKVSIICK